MRYCGKSLTRTATGYHVACPETLKKMKPIMVPADRRKNPKAKATLEEHEQFRSVVGEPWLDRPSGKARYGL